VVGRTPRGLHLVNGQPWYGRLYSPAVHVLAMLAISEIKALHLNAPLIASGGIHSTADVRECLAAGACAVEIDSAHWLDPNILARIRAELDTSR
jgi:dihydroorotate dehydrogenase